jgi:hypothetical protein
MLSYDPDWPPFHERRCSLINVMDLAKATEAVFAADPDAAGKTSHANIDLRCYYRKRVPHNEASDGNVGPYHGLRCCSKGPVSEI